MSKPNLENGWLGEQPRFKELKLKMDNYKESEIRVIADSHIIIKVQTGQPTKVVTKLTQCSNDKELPEYVFVQRKDDSAIHFHLGFPGNDFYKFMIFALPEKDSNESLPNVYNCLIHAERITKPAQPFAKAYTKFYKDHCVLYEPLILNSHTPYLERTKFEMIVPGVHKVAIHTKDAWHQLEKKSGDKWEGKVDLTPYKGTNTKVTANTCADKDGTSYSVILEWCMDH